MPSSLLQCVGRGYSDLCGAMCAAGLAAIEYQIWKEVDGIFTADPRKVPSARLLATVTAEEAAELTFFGSEVRSGMQYIPTSEMSHDSGSNTTPSIHAGYPPSYHGATRQFRDCLETEKRIQSQRGRDRDLSIHPRDSPPGEGNSAGAPDRLQFYAFQWIPWAV